MGTTTRSLWYCLACILLFISPATLQPAPLQVDVSPDTYGPDGPWQAFRVYVGNPKQRIDLFPGSAFDGSSIVIAASDCGGSTNCTEFAGGLYNATASATGEVNGFSSSGPPIGINFPLAGLDTAKWEMDEIWLGSTGVQNASLSVVTTGQDVYPGGQRVTYTLGGLDLGCAMAHETAGAGSHHPNIITSYLYNQQVIPSASFGLHVGSVEPNIPASFWFGGYDRSRVVESAYANFASCPPDAVPFVWTLNLGDISIKTAKGGSPFSSNASLTGLLSQNNESLQTTNSLQVGVNPLSTAMYLPRSTCDALTAELPVTFNDEIGLYTWNTDDPQYSKIVSSASYVSLSFNSFTGPIGVEIKIPFKLLNLTLEWPLAAQDTPYFPCSPINNSNYILGRSFLSAAFLGANWQINGTSPTFFIAQAPGPANISRDNATVTPIGANATAIASRSDGVSWEDTWEGFWTPLPLSLPQTHPGGGVSSGLSGGAKAGVAVGVVVGVLVLVTVSWSFLVARYRRRHPEWRSRGIWPGRPPVLFTQPELDDGTHTKQTKMAEFELHGQARAAELEAAYQQGFVAAARQYGHAHELPAFVELPDTRSEVASATDILADDGSGAAAGEAKEPDEEAEQEQNGTG